MRESVVERYLHRQVTKAGGTTRKWVSPGHKGVPDRIVIFHGTVHFVECKAPNGKLRADQAREHKRLIALGCRVRVIFTKQQVDAFVSLCSRGFLR